MPPLILSDPTETLADETVADETVADETVADETVADETLADETLATLARALAHPARLQILRTLTERGTCACGDVVKALPLAQSTVSQHLKVLADAGLVCGEPNGPRTCYCVDAEALARAQTSFAALFEGLVVPPACCA